MKSVSIAVLLSAAVFASSGCAHHVTIPTAPDANAPVAERREYHDEWTPIGAGITASYSRLSGQQLSQSSRYLQLHNGERVEWPQDLQPAVDAQSPTGRAIQEYDDFRGAFEATQYGALGTSLGGIALVVGGLAALGAAYRPHEQYDPLLSASALGLMGLGIVAQPAAIITSLVGILTAGVEAGKARETAFLTYESSLRARLGFKDGFAQPESAAASETAQPWTY